MRTFSIVGVAAIMFLFCFARITEADAASTYIPIRQSVATGTYHSPNYLSVVNGAIGRDNAYRMFSGVVGEKYPHAVGRFGKDEILLRAMQKQRTRRPVLLGFYAEDRFVEVNRDAGWKKVGDPFAKQRDVWRRIDGRVEYAQEPTHKLTEVIQNG